MCPCRFIRSSGRPPLILTEPGQSSLFARLPHHGHLLTRISRQGLRAVREGCRAPLLKIRLGDARSSFPPGSSTGVRARTRRFSRDGNAGSPVPRHACSPGCQASHLRLRRSSGGARGRRGPALRSRAGSAQAAETAGRPASVTAGVGILGTISSASGKATGETRHYLGPPGAPGRRARSLPALWSYRGVRPGKRPAALPRPRNFPGVPNDTPGTSEAE